MSCAIYDWINDTIRQILLLRLDIFLRRNVDQYIPMLLFRMEPSTPNTENANSGLKSKASNTGGIIFLNRFKYGSHRSLIADNGCRSHGIFGNQLSITLTINTPLYISSHFAIPAATTVSGVFKYPLGRSLIAAKNSGAAAHTAVSRRLLIAATSSALGRKFCWSLVRKSLEISTTVLEVEGESERRRRGLGGGGRVGRDTWNDGIGGEEEVGFVVGRRRRRLWEAMRQASGEWWALFVVDCAQTVKKSWSFFLSYALRALIKFFFLLF